nr:LysR substrate-binding domain-containing protein [Allopusillimonas ginsengisoli]
MQPNVIGAAVIERARLIVNELKNAEQEAQLLREGKTELRLGVTPMMMLDAVPRALQQFADRHPDTRVFINEGSVPTLCSALRSGSVDIVLSRPDPLFSSAPGLDLQPLFNEDPCVMACPSHPLLSKKRVRWEDLVHEKWILPPLQTFTWQNFAQAFIIRGLLPPEAHYECASFHSSVRLASRTSALMVAPMSVGAHYESLRLVKRLDLSFPGVLAPISLIQRSERPNVPVVNDFIETLLTIFN